MTNSENTQIRLKDCAIGPSQLRAARGMLGWTRRELAKRTNLSPETIKNTEHETYTPKEETLKAFVDVFAQSGLQFVSHDTIIANHTRNGAVKISYSGIVCVTASTMEMQGGAEQ